MPKKEQKQTEVQRLLEKLSHEEIRKLPRDQRAELISAMTMDQLEDFYTGGIVDNLNDPENHDRSN